MISSLQLSVPTKENKCINDCKFCIARQHNHNPENLIEADKDVTVVDISGNVCSPWEKYIGNIIRASRVVNNLVVTGVTEPQQNIKFLQRLSEEFKNNSIREKFHHIEFQSTGAGISDQLLIFLKENLGVDIFSLSISSFESNENSFINGMSPTNEVDIYDFCRKLKKYGFTIRLSLNMNSDMNKYTPEVLYALCDSINADQITFRVLSFISGTDQSDWIFTHQYKYWDELIAYTQNNGHISNQYSNIYKVRDMFVMIDNDCMANIQDEICERDDISFAKDYMGLLIKKEPKYLILKPDCNLYTKWDDPNSFYKANQIVRDINI